MSKNDRLIERLRSLDPADPATIDRLALDAEAIRDGILTDPADELSHRRRSKRRRIATTIAAVIAAIGLIVPIVLLSPLAGNEPAPPTVPGTAPTGPLPTVSPSPPTGRTSDAIDVLTPVPGERITSPVTIRGTADVFEATVSFRIVDATNNVIADGFTTATCGTGCRGEYGAEVPFSVGVEQPGVIKVFEVSAMDGSKINLVTIPVTLVPGPEDPITAEIEHVWYDGGRAVPTGEEGGPLELHFFEGVDHCGWTSVTFMNVSWPLGTQSSFGNGWRQYVRDPHGVLGDVTAVLFAPTTELPADARQSQYASGGGWFLWTAPSDEDQAVYLVNEDRGIVERWPRVIPRPTACD